MNSLPGSAVLRGLQAVLAGVVALAAFPLLATEGWVFEQSSLHFHFLTPWIAGSCVLIILGRVAGIFQVVLLRRLAVLATTTGEEAEAAGGWGISDKLRWAAVARAVAEGAALTLIAAALIAAVPELPLVLSDHPSDVDIGWLVPYLQVFDSLVPWTLVVLGLFTAGRAAKEAWPAYRDAWIWPWRRLVGLALLYCVMADDGWVTQGTGIAFGLLLPVMALAVALPYLASVIRPIDTVANTRRTNRAARVLLPLFECGEIALLLAAMVTLPSVVDSIPQGRYAETLATIGPYLDVFDTLATWSIILLTPFILVRAASIYKSAIGRVLPFPFGRIAVFGVALAAFSATGVLAVAFGLELGHLVWAVGGAALLSYVVLALRRVAALGLPEKITGPVNNSLALASALVISASITMVTWAILNALPSITAPAMDSERLSRHQDVFFPLVGNLYEARQMLTAFAFAFVLTLALPRPLWAPARWHVRPAVACVGFSVAGCLVWISAVQISGLGHGYTLGGAMIGIGLLALGMSQLAAYFVNFSDPAVSGIAGWLRESSQRPFWIGATIACYAMLLRPLIYETLWFAEVYEWVVILALALLAMLKIRSGLKSFVRSSEAIPATWNRWRRHEQEFQEHPDPRQELVSRWRDRFVETGEWASLWTYLMGLLCRNNSPPESVRSVVRPIRNSVSATSGKLPWNKGEQQGQQRREAALAETLHRVESVLTSPPSPQASIIEGAAFNQEAERFVESGEDPETMAALLVENYRRRGADLNHAVNLWFPLVDVVERPPRWFDLPWVRSRKRLASRERRRRLVEAATNHLSGQTTLATLPVALTARHLPVFPSASATASLGPTTVIAPGQGFEVLRDQPRVCLVRTGGNVEGYIHKAALELQPILPGDEVNGAYEHSQA